MSAKPITLLITCFEPFGGRETNASHEAVMALPEVLGPFELQRICLPVVFGQSAEVAIAAADQLQPAVVVCVGEAAGREEVTPERVAVNLRHARIPDTDGNQPQDEPVCADGPAEIAATLPVNAMVEAMREAGVPASISGSAGTYVCNDLMYLMLRHCQNTATPCGFIHVPAGETPDTATVTRGLAEALLALAPVVG